MEDAEKGFNYSYVQRLYDIFAGNNTTGRASNNFLSGLGLFNKIFPFFL